MKRLRYFHIIDKDFEENPTVALLGPRQCGKTTLAKQYAENIRSRNIPVHIFDLEDPIDQARLQNPRLALAELKGLIILDEIQRLPGLFEVLRVLADRPDNLARFLVLGSASRDLIQQGSETLAGRISFIEVTPFSLGEVGWPEWNRLWVRGGFPRSFLAGEEEGSWRWREDYVRTYLERDIPQLGIQIPAGQLRRFWMMLAHYHGQIFQASELARSLDVSDGTIKRHLAVLTGTFMIRALQPWHENISKRQVKRPKIFFRDTGIFHFLLGCPDRHRLEAHPKLGASWEGFALEETIRVMDAAEEECYFWSVHQQMELDLLLIRRGIRTGFEFKFSERPAVGRVHDEIIKNLKLEQLLIVTPADVDYPVTDKIRVMGLSRILNYMAVARKQS